MDIPLHIALKAKTSMDILFKIMYQSDLNIQNIDGTTPLHILLKKYNCRNFSTILRQKKLDIFQRTSLKIHVILK